VKSLDRIFLIGFMGVGKSVVGKVLAKKLNYDFMDPDDKEHWIKRGFHGGQTQVFWDDRQKYYDIETEILKDYITNGSKNFVYSTAGSIVLREENIDLMKSSGTIIYLTANTETLHDRVKRQGKISPKAEWIQGMVTFIKSREFKYKIADLEVDTNDKSIEEVCLTIISLLGL